MTSTRTLASVMFVLTVLATVVHAQESKLTPRTAQAYQSAQTGEAVAVWLYFDSSRTQQHPIALSERALRRRAKVDPQGLLIDSLDYRLDEGVVPEIESTGAKVKYSSRWLKAVAVEATEDQAGRLSGLRGLRRIDLVNAYRRAQDFPIKDISGLYNNAQSFTDAEYGPSLAQVRFTKATKLHAAGLSGKGVLIAMFDSGFNTHHRVFDSTSIIAQHDFINDADSVTGEDCPDDAETRRQDFHGTMTLGTIGGFLRDTLIGTAYGADFALAKTEITCYGEEIKQEEYNWIAAAEWADSLGADIISASLGYDIFQDSGSYTQSELDGHTALITLAAEAAASKNILVVTAAGNERQKTWGTISFPADGDSVLAVGAVDLLGNLAGFSSPGPTADGRIKPDIVSLGVGVYTARSLYETFIGGNGTSFSTPLVAGGAALAMEYDSTLTANELLNLIRVTGDRANNPNNDYGYGLYDASRSADIIKVDAVAPISVIPGERITVPVTTSGRAPQMPSITLPNPLPGVALTDFGDGTGQLQITGSGQNHGSLTFPLVASVPLFAETTYVRLSTYDQFSGTVRVGPNPFRDSVSIFIDKSEGSSVSVSVFNSAGEKVWESLNNSGASSDVITWDGRNSMGRETAPGVYLVQVSTDQVEKRLKLLKTK